MKDLLTQKEALIPLGLAESPEISLDLSFNSQDNGIFGVRRSAAILGLAISMSATGMLFAQQKAIAAGSVPLRSTFPHVTLPLETPPHPSSNTTVIHSIEVPLLKSELKSGESFQKPSKTFPQNSKEILSANLSSNQSFVAKNAHYPLKSENSPVLPSDQGSSSISLAANPTPEFDTSLDHLRETRTRLQQGLTELQSEQAAATANTIDTQIQSDDVSQPLHPIDKAAKVIPSQETALRPIIESEPNTLLSPSRLEAFSSPHWVSKLPPPASAHQKTTTLAASTLLDNGFNHPIPIPVPTPESAIPQSAVPSKQISTPQRLEVPSTRSQGYAPAPQKAEGSLINSANGSHSPAPSLAAFNQPIPLPVPTPPSQMNLSTPIQKPELQLSNPQALPVQPSDRNSSRANQTYQVRPGDTLNSIARLHGLSIEKLIRANQITNPNVITVSQSLFIPTPSPHPSSLPSISEASLPITASSSTAPVPSTPLPDQIEGAEIKSQPMEISGINPDRSHTKKLKSDISDLEATYGHPISGISIPVVQPPSSETISSVPDGSDMVNSEWQSNRKNPTSRNRMPQLPSLSRPPSTMTDGQIIGAAPTNVQEYNNNLRIPVGQEVSPELPPLSGPDHYLPDAPMQSSGYIWPAKGVLTSGYGWRWGRMHKGIDIAAPIGTPVLAAAPGQVISAGWNSGGYGNLVKILHADGSITVYAHNSRILVQQGQLVAQGEQISAMGSTGFSTGPHLHFEVHPGGKSAVNPIAYLPSKGKNL